MARLADLAQESGQGIQRPEVAADLRAKRTSLRASVLREASARSIVAGWHRLARRGIVNSLA
jgi:hypothetical protein